MGKIVGQKTPFKLKEIWAIRVRLQLADRRRELALFNLAIDSKLRACDLVGLRVRDVCNGKIVAARATCGRMRDSYTTAGVRGRIDEVRWMAAASWSTSRRGANASRLESESRQRCRPVPNDA
jgi:hypothetical protein